MYVPFLRAKLIAPFDSILQVQLGIDHSKETGTMLLPRILHEVISVSFHMIGLISIFIRVIMHTVLTNYDSLSVVVVVVVVVVVLLLTTTAAAITTTHTNTTLNLNHEVYFSYNRNCNGLSFLSIRPRMLTPMRCQGSV